MHEIAHWLAPLLVVLSCGCKSVKTMLMMMVVMHEDNHCSYCCGDTSM